MVWCGLHRGKLLALGLTWLAFLAGASAAAAADNVNYNGGPVAHSMTGVVVDWGPNINPMYTNESTGDPGLIKYLAGQSGATTDLGGILAQYMDSSGHNAANQVSYGGQHEINPSTSSNPVMDSQIRSELVNQVGSGALPHPAGNGLSTIYLVLFPQSDSECISSSECSANAPNPSTQDFCAYHSGTSLPDGTHLLYAVLPDDTTGHQSQWCGAAGSVFGDETSYMSHEWSETISDPLGNAWWVNNASSADDGNEIGDSCNQQMTSEGGWTVQLEWSNLDRNCVAGESAYGAPTASFLAPSVGEPGQSLSFDASSSSDPAADSTAISGSSYSIGSGLTSYSWNWGDGTTSTSVTPTATHSFAATGSYQVSLTITDKLGFTSTVTKSVAVTGNGVLPPSATTGATTGVSVTGATVNGTVNAENNAVQYQFVYGTSATSLSQSTPLTAGPSGQSNTAVSSTLAGLLPATTYYYRLDVLSGGQTFSGAVQSFTTDATPPPAQTPTVATGSASVGPGSAVVSGTINPGGAEPVSYHFSYGTSAANLSNTTAPSTGPSGTTSVPVSATLSGLQNHTTYYFRLDVSLNGHTYSGTVKTFSTKTQPPGAGTGKRGKVTSNSATVSGTVNPNGLSTSYLIEFGTSGAYGHSTPSASAGAGSASLPVSVTLSGLRARTLYHYRLVATNAGGTSVGADQTFRTSAAPGPAPRFSFAVPASVAGRAALHGRLRVRFSCSRACTSHFVVTVGSARATRFAPVAVTLARGTGRISRRGSGRVTLRFMPGVRSRLRAQHGVRLVVYGYAVAGASTRSTPKTRRLTLS